MIKTQIFFIIGFLWFFFCKETSNFEKTKSETTTEANKTYDEVYNTVTFNGRYQQSSYDAQHFNIFGTQFILGYNIKF